MTQKNSSMFVAGQKYATAYASKDSHHILQKPGTNARSIIAAAVTHSSPQLSGPDPTGFPCLELVGMQLERNRPI